MGYENEYIEARQTLRLSADTAAGFVRQLGALSPILIPPFPGVTLGKRPGFQQTVLDHKYWFAKLYELVTYQELTYAITTQYPGFTLHFMKVFYLMYYTALQNFMKRSGLVSPLWATSFTGPPADKDGNPPEASSMEAVQFCVRTGAIAHIQGDMPMALVTGYKTWAMDPKPDFQDLRSEFIDKSESAFSRAQAAFYLDVNDKTFSPLRPEVGQIGAVYYQAVLNIQPSLPVMFQWRRDAWQKAVSLLQA
jgi:hypothetical protein